MTQEEQLAWQKSLKPGDEVVVLDGFYNGAPKCIRAVSSVTKSGRVRIWRSCITQIDTVEYGCDGRSRGERSGGSWHISDFYHTSITPVTPELRKVISESEEREKQERWERDVRQRLMYGLNRGEVKELTVDQLRAVAEILWATNGGTP